MRRTTVVIDIHTIWQRMNNFDFCPQFTKDAWHNLIGSTVCAVQNNFHSLKALRTSAQDKLDVLVQKIRAVLDMTDFIASRTSKIIIIFQLMNDFFQFILNSIRQFVTITTEEFNAIIMERIVGGRDNDTCFCLMTASQICDSRRRDNPRQHCPSASRANSRRQSSLKHLTGQTGIAANNDERLFFGFFAEVNRRSTSQTICHLRHQNRICLSADTIRTK